MKVLGYERNCFRTVEGAEVKGYNVYFGRQIEIESGKGVATERVYLSDARIADNKLDLAKLLNAEVDVLYNRYGKVQRIVPAS